MRYFLLLSILAIGIIFAGCSNSRMPGSNPSNPVLPQMESDITGAQVVYTGSFDIDLIDNTITVRDDRLSELVYNITGFMSNKCAGGCFRFRILSIIGSVLEIELTVENPTMLQVYDLRIVYLNLYGKTVLNPDSYTDFPDTPGFNIYPFTAFAKENPDRAFPVGPGGIDIEILYLDYPPGSLSAVNYAVTASYPGQTKEPYEISDMNQTGELTPSGGNATISTRVDDHQNDISSVVLDARPFTGAFALMIPSVPDPDYFEVEISNTQGAPIGTYNQIIRAQSPNPQNINTYNFVLITVTEEIENVIYVDDSYVGPPWDGTIAHPFNTITEGLNAATDSYQVWVDDSGNDYEEHITLKSNVVLKSVNWDTSDGGDMASIYGGGTGTIVGAVANSTIDGFKIYGGYQGLSIYGEKAKILNCVISDIGLIYSSSIVTAIYAGDSPGSLIENCEITNCELNTVEGGILNCFYLYNSPMTIKGCDIHDNRKTLDAGIINAIYLNNCKSTPEYKMVIRNNKIHDLDFQQAGFVIGIYLLQSENVHIHNNLIYDFDMIQGGANIGIYFNEAKSVGVYNNVIYDFETSEWPSSGAHGMYVDENSLELTAFNNIIGYFRNGLGEPIGWDVYWSVDNIKWNYNDTYSVLYNNAPSGIGNITENPLFIDPLADFHLATGSPCIDAGDPSVQDTDGTRSDMGAYGGPFGDW